MMLSKYSKNAMDMPGLMDACANTPFFAKVMPTGQMEIIQHDIQFNDNELSEYRKKNK